MNQILEGAKLEQELDYEVDEPIIIESKSWLKSFKRSHVIALILSLTILFISITAYFIYSNLIVVPTQSKVDESYIPVTDIILDGEKIVLSKNDTYMLIPTIVPDDSTNRKILYDSQVTDVFEITEDGLITAKNGGQAALKIKVENENIEKEIQVLVQNTAESIVVEEENVTLNVGETKKINAYITPEDSINQYLAWSSADENVVKVDENGIINAIGTGATTVTVQTVYQPVILKTIQVEIMSKENTRVVAGVASSYIGLKYVNGILIVNKKYTLPSTYNPGLDLTTLENFNKMQKGAENEGIELRIISGFRSYQTQQAIFEANVKLYGEKEANRSSARVGQSEHQAGLALDINSLSQSFSQTKEGKWLAKNCHKYGFIIRYPEGKEHITGYIYEPWHIRYVGTPLSTQIYECGLTLEEFLHVD